MQKCKMHIIYWDGSIRTQIEHTLKKHIQSAPIGMAQANGKGTINKEEEEENKLQNQNLTTLLVLNENLNDL